MVAEVEIRNAEDFAELAKRIRQHADAKALRRELFSGLQRATKGLRAEMQEAIVPALPTRGGLASFVRARAKLSTQSRTGGTTAGVRIVSGNRGGPNLARYNAGRFRHPVFGRGWVEQSAGVTPGFLDVTFDRAAPPVRKEVLRVMGEVARKVAT